MEDTFEFDPVDLFDEDPSQELHFFGLPGSLAKSIKRKPNIIAGDLIGSLGIPLEIDPKEVDSSLKMYIKNIKEITKADNLAELIITCSNFPSKNYKNIFKKIEQHLFYSPSSVKLKDGISSKDQSVLLSFHMLRAYMRAEEGDFDSADKIWEQLNSDWIEVDEKKKTHLLLHLFMTSLCVKNIDKALLYMKILWAAVKGMNTFERHEYAIWDNWTCCLIITWFFSLHSEEFFTKLKKESGIYTTYYFFQKKKIILDHMNKSFIPTLMSIQYYKKAQTYYPKLPDCIS